MTTWHEIDCPRCGARDFVNNGDESDQTVSDVEAVLCWGCGYLFDWEGNPATGDPCVGDGQKTAGA